MYNRFHLAILSRLFSLHCIGAKHTSKENAVRGLRNFARESTKAFEDLRRWNLIIIKPTSYGTQVSLNPKHIADIQILLNPGSQLKDKPLLEDTLNAKYNKRSFYTSQGEKTVKGINAVYSYHTSLSNPAKIIVYIIVDGEKKSAIELGSFNDENSLLSKTVKKIDESLRGQPFSKLDIYKLGKDIEGNRQQPKAIIDMLLYFNYIIKKGDIIKKGQQRYQRTSKQLPKTNLHQFQHHAPYTT